MLKDSNKGAFAVELNLFFLEQIMSGAQRDLSTDFKSAKSIIENNKSWTIKNEGDTVRAGNKFMNLMGIYSFTPTDYDINNSYIGLTQNYTNRLKMHYMLSVCTT
jgi:hypothetical protein